MRILAIESSGTVASCAILTDDKLEGEIILNHKLQHSVILIPIIEKLLEMVEADIDTVDGIAVSGGPGSFTGLRIGVAAAKGIAQGGNKKFTAVSSLDAMAFQQVGYTGIICPMMDALREDIYTALYTWQGGELFKLQDYTALSIHELIEILEKRSERVIFCGDGVEKHIELIKEKLKDRCDFAPASISMPRASSIAELAKLKFNRGIEDDIYTYSPVYIRKSQAEREYERKNGKAE